MSCNCCEEATVTPCTGVTTANIGELTLIKGKRSNACDAWQEVPAFICESLNQTLAKKLADGEVPVAATATDVVITADCKLVNLNGAASPETPLTTTNTPSVNLTAGGAGNGHTGVSADVNISAMAGNAVVINADGLFVPTAVAVFDDQVITVVNTPTVSMVATPAAPVGADNQVNYSLSADVNVSATANNQLVANADGLFVDQGAGFSFRVTTGATAVPPAGGVTVSQGDALHFWSATGLAFNITVGSAVIQADLSLSTDAGNAAVFGTDGKLYVPTPGAFAETPLTVTDSDSINLTAGGAGNGHTGLTAELKVSALPNNGATIQPDGIYFFQQGITVSSPNNTIAGTATGVWSHDVQLDAKISNTPGNSLTFDANGLYVPTPAALAETPLTVTDSTSINLTAGGAGNGHTGLTAAVILDPSADNVISDSPTGLTASPCSIGAAVVARVSVALPAQITGVTGGCLEPLAVSQYQALFGDAGNLVQQDARFFYEDNLGSFAAVGSSPTLTGANAAIVGGRSGSASGQDSFIGGGFTTFAQGIGAAVIGSNISAAAGNNSGIYSSNECNATADRAVIIGGHNSNATAAWAGIYSASSSNNAGVMSAILGGNVNNIQGGQGNVILGGESNVIAGSQNNVVGGLNNVVPATTTRAAVFGFDQLLVGNCSDILISGQNNRPTDSFASIIGGVGNQVTGQRNIVAGNLNTVNCADSFIAGQNNVVNGISNIVIGRNLTLTNGVCTSEGVVMLGTTAEDVTCDPGSERFVIGVGDAFSVTKRTGLSLRGSGALEMMPYFNVGASAFAGVQPDNATAIAMLNTDIASYGHAVRFGAFALVNVAGVPTFFKYDGTTWMFAF